MNLLKLILIPLLFSSLSLAQNPFSWLDNLVNTEEHLLHQEQIGPYVLNADGQRLLHDPYLRLKITQDGKAIPSDSSVRVESTLFLPNQQLKKTYLPEHDGQSFLMKPLELEDAKSMSWDEGGWLRMDIFIDGPAGEANETLGIYIYPPKLETGNLFRLINIMIPLLVLGFFVFIYKLTNVRLRQTTVA